MSGFSFDLKKIKAFLLNVDGVLSSSIITVQFDGEFSRTFNIKDLSAIKKATSEGFLVGVLSEFSDYELSKYLNIFSFNPKFIYLNVQNKEKCVKEFLESNDLSEENLLFIAYDSCDKEILTLNCLSVAPVDASIDVLQRAKYLSPHKGGDGVVRDVVEQVLKAHSKW